jgi:transposase
MAKNRIKIDLADDEWKKLRNLAERTSIAGKKAKSIILFIEGKPQREVAKIVGTHGPMVNTWIRKFLSSWGTLQYHRKENGFHQWIESTSDEFSNRKIDILMFNRDKEKLDNLAKETTKRGMKAKAILLWRSGESIEKIEQRIGYRYSTMYKWFSGYRQLGIKYLTQEESPGQERKAI